MRITYEVIEHNGGWAYKVGEVYSETFATRPEAIDAAERAAEGHMRSGTDETIEYEDENGAWHEEPASGDDRPQIDVETDSRAALAPKHDPYGLTEPVNETQTKTRQSEGVNPPRKPA